MELLTCFALPRDVFEMLMSKYYYLPFLKSNDEYWVCKPWQLPKAAVFLLSLNFCHILLKRLTLIFWEITQVRIYFIHCAVFLLIFVDLSAEVSTAAPKVEWSNCISGGYSCIDLSGDFLPKENAPNVKYLLGNFKSSIWTKDICNKHK